VSLWDEAVAVYARPGVKAACLELQNRHGQCVSYLLWAGWAAQSGRFVDAEGLAACAKLARWWDDEAVKPARRAAVKLDAMIADFDESARARAHAMVWEQALTPERLLLAALEARTPACGARPAVAEALQAAARAWGDHPAPTELITILAAAYSPH
jgi:uncharacterized protein (TIGR02444 family)